MQPRTLPQYLKMIGNMIAGITKLRLLPLSMALKPFLARTTALPKKALLWVEIKCFMFSVFCKSLQMSVGHMLVECYSASSNSQIFAKEL